MKLIKRKCSFNNCKAKKVDYMVIDLKRKWISSKPNIQFNCKKHDELEKNVYGTNKIKKSKRYIYLEHKEI